MTYPSYIANTSKQKKQSDIKRQEMSFKVAGTKTRFGNKSKSKLDKRKRRRSSNGTSRSRRKSAPNEETAAVVNQEDTAKADQEETTMVDEQDTAVIDETHYFFKKNFKASFDPDVAL